MALSGTVSFDYTSTNGGRLTLSYSKSFTPAAEPAKTDIIAVGTTDETLAKGDVSTIGLVYVRVLDTDAAKHVLIGSDGTNYPIKIKGGQPAALFGWNATDVHVKGSVAVQFQYALFST